VILCKESAESVKAVIPLREYSPHARLITEAVASSLSPVASGGARAAICSREKAEEAG
jgi:hypothetical protein